MIKRRIIFYKRREDVKAIIGDLTAAALLGSLKSDEFEKVIGHFESGIIHTLLVPAAMVCGWRCHVRAEDVDIEFRGDGWSRAEMVQGKGRVLAPALITRPKFKIGDTVWVIDPNHREYTKPAEGHTWGEPIYRAQFREKEIIGETRLSWLVGSHGCEPTRLWALTKFKKANPRGLYTAEGVEAAVWIHDNGYALGERVKRCQDLATLHEIVTLLDRSHTLEEP